MRAFEFLQEKIVHRDTRKHHPDYWLNTVIAVNPSKSEFWSSNFRQGKDGEKETPTAAGVILDDGTVIVGIGHLLSHDVICDLAGFDINDEWVRLQIHDGKVYVEIWLGDEVTWSDPIEKKISAAEKLYEMSIDDIKKKVSQITSRFVPGWKVVCLLWTDGHDEEV